VERYLLEGDILDVLPGLYTGEYMGCMQLKHLSLYLQQDPFMAHSPGLARQILSFAMTLQCTHPAVGSLQCLSQGHGLAVAVWELHVIDAAIGMIETLNAYQWL